MLGDQACGCDRDAAGSLQGLWMQVLGMLEACSSRQWLSYDIACQGGRGSCLQVFGAASLHDAHQAPPTLLGIFGSPAAQRLHGCYVYIVCMASQLSDP